jgi:hypothetical protein
MSSTKEEQHMRVEIGYSDGVSGIVEDTPHGLRYRGAAAASNERLVQSVAGDSDPLTQYPGGWLAFVENELLRSCNNGYGFCRVLDGDERFTGSPQEG